MWRRKGNSRYYLLNCEFYDEERDALRRSVGAQGMRISILLGDPQIIKQTMEYMEKIGPFQARSKIIQRRYLKKKQWKGKM
jgi:hypothetical protein